MKALSFSICEGTFSRYTGSSAYRPALKELAQFVTKLSQWPDLREASIRGIVVLPETVTELHRFRPMLSLWHDGVATHNAPETPSED